MVGWKKKPERQRGTEKVGVRMGETFKYITVGINESPSPTDAEKHSCREAPLPVLPNPDDSIIPSLDEIPMCWYVIYKRSTRENMVVVLEDAVTIRKISCTSDPIVFR